MVAIELLHGSVCSFAFSAARSDLLGRYLLINCLVRQNTMLGQVQPWSYAVDFSCLSPNEGFTPEVFLSFIYLLIFFFWLCCSWQLDVHLSMCVSGRHEEMAIRQLRGKLIVQLCYSSLKRASEGRRDEKSFCRFLLSEVQLLQLGVFLCPQSFVRLWFLGIRCSSLVSRYSCAYNWSASDSPSVAFVCAYARCGQEHL